VPSKFCASCWCFAGDGIFCNSRIDGHTSSASTFLRIDAAHVMITENNNLRFSNDMLLLTTIEACVVVHYYRRIIPIDAKAV
jgi:hypothetical protein